MNLKGIYFVLIIVEVPEFFLYFYERKMDELKIEKNSRHFLKCDELFNIKDDYYKASEVEIFKIAYN